MFKLFSQFNLGVEKKLADAGRDGQFNLSREIKFSGMNGNRENSFSNVFS